MTENDKRAEKLIQQIETAYRQRPANLETARSAIGAMLTAFLGVREIGTTNTGYWVDKFHQAIAIRPGLAWCMMLLQYVYKVAPSWLGLPDLIPNNTAGTLNFGNWAMKNGYTISSFIDLKESDILVWCNGKGSDKGHVGAVKAIERPSPGIVTITTIEGNTSGEDSGGDYRDGGLIAEKLYTYTDKVIGKVSSKRYLYCVVSFDKLYNAVVK